MKYVSVMVDGGPLAKEPQGIASLVVYMKGDGRWSTGWYRLAADGVLVWVSELSEGVNETSTPLVSGASKDQDEGMRPWEGLTEPGHLDGPVIEQDPVQRLRNKVRDLELIADELAGRNAELEQIVDDLEKERESARP
jgi:hypothetical protein